MTTLYPIQAHTRVCAGTGRPLQPGERYYSALFDQNGQFLRQDYSKDAWTGAPESSLAFWSGRVPDLSQKRRLTFDDELLLDCFARLAEETDPARVQFRYVLALLLLRRKRLKFHDIRREDDREYLQLKCVKTGSEFEVLDPHLSEADTDTVQEEVFKVLGWE